MGNKTESGLTLKDLERTPHYDYMHETIDSAILKDVSALVPNYRGVLNERTMNSILANLEKGCSLKTACAAANQVPQKVYAWLKKGMTQYQNLTPDELSAAEDDNSLLPAECRFWLKVNAAIANFEVQMQSILYDHSSEEDKIWIAQWELGVVDPLRYNVKYRTHREDMENENAGGNVKVEFQIVDGTKSRSADEIKEINDSLKELSDEYKDEGSADAPSSESAPSDTKETDNE